MTNNDNGYNSKRAWYELKPTLVDRAAPFDFNLVKLRNTGYIFLSTAIFAPFLLIFWFHICLHTMNMF
ncbi:hypothetical protein [Spiroplasma citri]|uniref:hypothetical protein n=1 Tax=Spiroplasma citri TaxID=2133 RepID=UPI001EE226B7|nr:hypothetical protein [Spiroplasma citri]